MVPSSRDSCFLTTVGAVMRQVAASLARKRLGEITHFVKGSCALMQPGKHLLSPEGRLTQLAKIFSHFLQSHGFYVNQVSLPPVLRFSPSCACGRCKKPSVPVALRPQCQLCPRSARWAAAGQMVSFQIRGVPARNRPSRLVLLRQHRAGGVHQYTSRPHIFAYIVNIARWIPGSQPNSLGSL